MIMLARPRSIRNLVASILLLAVLFASFAEAFLVARSKLRQSLSSSTAPIEYEDFLPCPNPRIVEAVDVVYICMDSLMSKSNNEGLEVCFNFSSNLLQAPFGGQLEKFIEHANNPVFASLVNCIKFEVVSMGPLIEGTRTRGAMQTVLMDVQSPDSEDRRFLWTLQKERRPPRQDCWLVHEVLFTDNAMQQTT